MLDFSNVIIQVNICLGIPLLIAGVFGNIFNMIVLYKTDIRNSSNLILFCGSWASLAYISIGLSTRVIAGNFLVDWTTMSVHWCRARFYLAYVTLFASISYMCYASINQFFITSSSLWLRELSSFKRAKRAVVIIFIFWLLHFLPIAILGQQVLTASGALSCNVLINPYLKQYISYFILPFLSAVTPIIFLAVVGYLTYRNITNLQRANIQQRAQRHLTSMILLQTVCIIIESFPNGSYYLYSIITSTTSKGPDRIAVENLIFQSFGVLYYFPHVVSFFVYLITSASFRDQVRVILHMCLRQNQVAPSQVTTIHLRAGRTRVEPTQKIT